LDRLKRFPCHAGTWWREACQPTDGQGNFFLVSLKDFVFYITYPNNDLDESNQAGGNASLIISAPSPMGLRTRKGNSYVGC